jgi:hypothetical protein
MGGGTYLIVIPFRWCSLVFSCLPLRSLLFSLSLSLLPVVRVSDH